MSKFITVQRIAKGSAELAQFIENKCFILHLTCLAALISFYSFDYRLHICSTVLQVENDTLQIHFRKSLHHTAVHLSQFPTQVDLTVDSLLMQI